MRKTPLSPHLQIYKLPLNALLSISHRIAGVLLFLVFVVFVGVLFTLSLGETEYLYIEPLFDFWLIKFLIYLALFAFFFHCLNGVRHILWDHVIGISKNASKLSSVFIIVFTLVLFSLWFLWL